MSGSTKTTWLARVATWLTSWRAKRRVKLKKREDARIRRIVATETAIIKRESQKTHKRGLK
jgi:hypothetical protein